MHIIKGFVMSSTNNFAIFSSSDSPMAIDERALRPPYLYELLDWAKTYLSLKYTMYFFI